MKHSFSSIIKKAGVVALCLSMVCSIAACGKKKGGSSDDPQAAIRNEVVNFVNVELASITSDRDEAIAAYNAYFASDDKDPQTFKTTLDTDAIPKMQKFVDSLNAIETKSEEVSNLKSLYSQGAQCQLDAMNKVSTAIGEENPDYLAEANVLINDAKSFYSQYESQLRLLSVDYSITINGSFSNDAEPATEGVVEGETSVEVESPAEETVEAQ